MICDWITVFVIYSNARALFRVMGTMCIFTPGTIFFLVQLYDKCSRTFTWRQLLYSILRAALFPFEVLGTALAAAMHSGSEQSRQKLLTSSRQDNLIEVIGEAIPQFIIRWEKYEGLEKNWKMYFFKPSHCNVSLVVLLHKQFFSVFFIAENGGPSENITSTVSVVFSGLAILYGLATGIVAFKRSSTINWISEIRMSRDHNQTIDQIDHN